MTAVFESWKGRLLVVNKSSATSTVGYILRQVRRRIKFCWQWCTVGFSDYALYSVYTALAKHALPRLERFRKITMSHPIDVTMDEWYAELDLMINALRVCVSEDTELRADLTHEDWEKVQSGLELFGKRFRHLWS